MGTYVRSADGRFNGSVGDGKTRVPTVSSVPRSASPAPDGNTTAFSSAQAAAYQTLYAKFHDVGPYGLDRPEDDASVAIRAAVAAVPHDQTRQGNDDGLHAYQGTAGAELFVLDGKYHNVDGPAVIAPNGTVLYMQHGFLHRTDGPAVVLADGTRHYFRHGKYLFTRTAEGTVRDEYGAVGNSPIHQALIATFPDPDNE